MCLYETNLNIKSKTIASTKLLIVCVLRSNEANNSILQTIHFIASMKTPVLCNLFKLFCYHIRAGILPFGGKDEEKMTVVLFVSLSPGQCDGKSKNLE